jgi:hypothetical protein
MLAATCALLRSPPKEPSGESAQTPPPACWAPHGSVGAASASGAGALAAAADDSALPLLPPLTLRSAARNLRCHVVDTLLDVYAAHLAFVTQARKHVGQTMHRACARSRVRARACSLRARALTRAHTHTHARARVRALRLPLRASSSPRRRCLLPASLCWLFSRLRAGFRMAWTEVATLAAWCQTSTGHGSPASWSSRCAWAPHA